jgi:hypothetical protein
MFRLLWKHPDRVERIAEEFNTYDDALVSAKTMVQTAGTVVVVTQDVSEVTMAPSVVPLVPTPPAAVYRESFDNHGIVSTRPEPPENPKVDVVKRAPQARPRLLVLTDRQAKPSEVVEHLMVVAQGQIVKNAFGALELDDMPLTPSEMVEVKRALGQG